MNKIIQITGFGCNLIFPIGIFILMISSKQPLWATINVGLGVIFAIWTTLFINIELLKQEKQEVKK